MNIDHSFGCSRGDICSPRMSQIQSPQIETQKDTRRIGTAALFSPNPSVMNMFNMNMGPLVVDVLDPHFDLNDGLAQRRNNLRGKRGSLNLP